MERHGSLSLSLLVLFLVYRPFRAHANAARRDNDLALLVAVLGHGLRKNQLAGTATFFFPCFAGLDGSRQDIARAQRPMIFKVLLGVQSATATTSAAFAAHDTRRVLAGTEPEFADLRPQEIVRIELGAVLGESRRCDKD